MSRNAAFFCGLSTGASLLLFFDPNRGRRRRAVLRDKFENGVRQARDAAGATGRDLVHRAEGTAARLANLGRQHDVPDEVLLERVRAKFGRYVSHPRAIDVTAINGLVTLTGSILAAEHKRLLSAIDHVPGVDQIDDRLDVYKEAGGVPDLQGGSARTGEPYAFQRRLWSPAARLLAGVAGGSLAAYGVTRRDPVGVLLTLAGVGIAVRGITNVDTARLTGIGAGRRAVDIQKTIDISAPIDRVFEFWNSYENFPRFVAHVKDVRPTRVPGQSHWTVAGPAGAPIQFDAMLTEFLPNELIAWKTARSAAVQHAGVIRFEPLNNGGTRLHMRMSYNPPGGALGDAIASLFGADLKSELDADLIRIQTFLETGRVARDAARQPEPVS